MKNRLSKTICIDAALILLSIVFGLMIRLEIVYVGAWIKDIWPFMLLTLVLRLALLWSFGIYRRIWRYATTGDFLRLALAIVVGSIAISAITLLWLFPRLMHGFPRSLLILEMAITLLLLGGFRVGLRLLERFQGDINWQGMELPPTKRTLIVGAGKAGTRVAKELQQNPLLGFNPVAYLDDDPVKIGHQIGGLPVEGPLIKLAAVAAGHTIEEVLIAIPSAPTQTQQSVKSLCQQAALVYSVIPPMASTLEYGSPPGSSARLPMSLPDIKAEEIQAVVRVMQSRNLSIGLQTTTLEELAAQTAGAQYGVAVTNGTCGLHLCMVAAGVGPGDEVITSPYSFIASANCILFQQATPVFVDIDPVTLNLDPVKLEAAITERTRAIIPVHIFGQPADLDPILEIAARHQLSVIEDAAEAIGATYKGRPVGAQGNAGIFAFYPNKQMTTGEGAMIVTNDENWANLFRSLRNQGRDVFDEWLRHSRLGYNYRMSELNAAVGVVQLRRLDQLLRKREAVAGYYQRALAGMTHLAPLTIAPTTTRMSWFVYVVRFAPGINRDQVLKGLAARGIPARPYFSPIHLQPFYQARFGFKPGDFPVAEEAGSAVLALPFHGLMNKEEVEMVVAALAEVLEEVR